jgi:hypothetical protein
MNIRLCDHTLFGSAGVAKYDIFNTPQQHLNISRNYF